MRNRVCRAGLRTKNQDQRWAKLMPRTEERVATGEQTNSARRGLRVVDPGALAFEHRFASVSRARRFLPIATASPSSRHEEAFWVEQSLLERAGSSRPARCRTISTNSTEAPARATPTAESRSRLRPPAHRAARTPTLHTARTRQVPLLHYQHLMNVRGTR